MANFNPLAIAGSASASPSPSPGREFMTPSFSAVRILQYLWELTWWRSKPWPMDT
jgi:hypothetical protein